MQSPFPIGFNDNIYHEGNISKMPHFYGFFLLWNVKNVKVDLMVNVEMATISAKVVLKTQKYFSKGSFYSFKYIMVGMAFFSFISFLSISVLRNLEKEANKLYDRANKLYKAPLVTRCYVQHFFSPYTDTEVNHKRHFIKIPFINKSMEFIDLHSIFKDNLINSSIPNYFNNSETPIICYKYNKPIRSNIFNSNKIVTDINIDSITPDS